MWVAIEVELEVAMVDINKGLGVQGRASMIKVSGFCPGSASE